LPRLLEALSSSKSIRCNRERGCFATADDAEEEEEDGASELNVVRSTSLEVESFSGVDCLRRELETLSCSRLERSAEDDDERDSCSIVRCCSLALLLTAARDGAAVGAGVGAAAGSTGSTGPERFFFLKKSLLPLPDVLSASVESDFGFVEAGGRSGSGSSSSSSSTAAIRFFLRKRNGSPGFPESVGESWLDESCLDERGVDGAG